MRHLIILTKHEIRMMMISPAIYIAAILFLTLMGFIYVIILQDFTCMAQEYLPSEAFFKVFWIPVLFMVPLLTMKSIAEERRLGTLETLMTTSASSTVIVLSKFIGAYSFYLLLWLSTLTFPWIASISLSQSTLGGPLSDTATLIGGLLFVATSGALYTSVGLFASSLTRSQLVAGMLCFTILFILLIGGRLLLELPTESFTSLTGFKHGVDYLQTFQHLDDFSRGIIDTRPFCFYITNALLILGITITVVESKV